MICLVAAALVAFAIVARGPEGTAVQKDMEERLTGAAENCGSVLVTVTTVAPETIRIPRHAYVKHMAKYIVSWLGIVNLQRSRGQDYEFASGIGRVHCLARFSGDHLIGLELRFHAINREFADCLDRVFRTEFQHDILPLTRREET